MARIGQNDSWEIGVIEFFNEFIVASGEDVVGVWYADDC